MVLKYLTSSQISRKGDASLVGTELTVGVGMEMSTDKQKVWNVCVVTGMGPSGYIVQATCLLSLYGILNQGAVCLR